MPTIRELRERAGLTPSELAQAARVSYQTVRRLERGERISRTFLMRILNVLGAREEDVDWNVKED
jgi:transcriptional regulator with XRE-family HTH domain